MRKDLYFEVYTDAAGDIRWRAKQDFVDYSDTVFLSPDTFESAEYAEECVRDLMPGTIDVRIIE